MPKNREFRKCKYCDKEAKRNITKEGRNKGIYRTCGSIECLKKNYKNELVNSKKRHLGKDNPNYGKYGKNSPNYGKKMSEETFKILEKKVYSKMRNKTYEERFGEEKAKETKQKMEKNIYSKRRNKKFEEIYGEDKAKEIKKMMSLANSGEKCYLYKGGISLGGYNWCEFNNSFKNSIRKRDNQVCMNCGIHREKLKDALNVHHINYDKKLSIPENCCSLCNKCHSLTNTNRDYWTKLFQEKLSKLYGYKYLENGDIILNLKEENAI